MLSLRLTVDSAMTIIHDLIEREDNLMLSGNRIKIPFFVLLIALVIAISAETLSAYEIDSSRVRPKPAEKQASFAEILLRIPGVILNSPFYILEGMSGFVVNEIVYSEIGRRIILEPVERLWGIFPAGGYSESSGLRYGFTFSSRDVLTKGERFRVKSTWSTNHYRTHEISYDFPGDFGIFKDAVILAHYKRKPRQSFYGLGNKTSDDFEASVFLEETRFQAIWAHSLILQNLKLGLDLSYSNYNLYDGEDPDHFGDLEAVRDSFDLALEVLSDTRIITGGISLIHDWRDRIGRPGRGGFQAVSLYYSKGTGSTSEIEYLTLKIDLRQYIEFYLKRMLSFRIYLEASDPLENSPPLPYYLRPSLGGEELLLGFEDRRFIENGLALAVVEYRYPILGMLDAYVFYEQGRVFEAISEQFTFDNWKYSTGFGLKAWTDEDVILNIAVAFSGESPQFYIMFTDNI
jgi:outer membrane protein assembly factor BamA